MSPVEPETAEARWERCVARIGTFKQSGQRFAVLRDDLSDDDKAFVQQLFEEARQAREVG